MIELTDSAAGVIMAKNILVKNAMATFILIGIAIQLKIGADIINADTLVRTITKASILPSKNSIVTNRNSEYRKRSH